MFTGFTVFELLRVNQRWRQIIPPTRQIELINFSEGEEKALKGFQCF